MVDGKRVSPQLLCLLHSGRGLVLAHDGRPAAARAAAREAVVHGRGAYDAPVLGAAVDDAAQAALLGGDPYRALVLLAAADTLRGGPDLTRPWTATVAGRARAAAAGDAVDAAEEGRKATIENILEYFPPPDGA
jgi:hypothetical protein